MAWLKWYGKVILCGFLVNFSPFFDKIIKNLAGIFVIIIKFRLATF